MSLRRHQASLGEPSQAIDSPTVRVTYEYLASGTVWLLVGTIVGLLAALKLNWPDALAVPALSFGRLRPMHTNTVFWGWSSMGLTGMCLYIVARTPRTSLWSPRLSRIALWSWNAAVVAGLATLAGGVTRGPQEYREFVWPVAALFVVGVVLNGYNI